MYSPCFCLHNMMKTGMKMIKMIKIMMVRMKMMVGMNLHNMMKIELKIINLIKITIMKMRTMTVIKRLIMITVIVLALVFFVLMGFSQEQES